MTENPTTRGTRSIEFALDVSQGLPLERAVIAGTLVAPAKIAGSATVVCAFPGGGYSRRYYDLHHPELSGPSQAQWHAERGTVFVAFDPFGDGDGTSLEPEQRSLQLTVQAFDMGVRQLVDRLEHGTLHADLPALRVDGVVALGHSLGGMQLVAQQGRHGTFDAVAILGWSCQQTVVPSADGEENLAPHHGTDQTSLTDAWAGPLVDEIAHLRYAYHWDDVPEQLVSEDMSAGFPERTADPLPPWITRTFPPFAAICLEEGVVRDEASLIATPVYVACGERDVLPDIRHEATAFTRSTDISLFVIPNCAHMHNFSPQRHLLWDHLQLWIDGLRLPGR